MDNITTLAKNAIMLQNPKPRKLNGKYTDQGKGVPWFAYETNEYTNMMAEYADTVYETASQGLDSEDWFKYVPIKIRTIAAAQGNTSEIMPDDWQKIFIISPKNTTYIPQGAYMYFAENWWIVYKPRNMGAPVAHAVLRRCNTVINKLDYYGNIVAIPMSFDKMGTLGNSSHASENSIVAKNYMECVIQNNSFTADFIENTRLILGKSAYQIRGLNDFTREQTNDPDSIHLLTFTIERTQPLEQDNMELQIADYYSFSWDLRLTVNDAMNTNSEQQIGVTSVRNGQNVQSTEKYPIEYKYESSNESVATVDENGLITAIGEGTAVITVTLVQNESITSSVELTVADTGEQYVQFTNSPIAELGEFDSVTLTASYFDNGTATDDTVTFTLSGATADAYGYEIDGNSITITCYSASTRPLVITASANGETATTEIHLTY